MHREMFYQLHTTWTTNTDNQLVKNDMNVNEHEGLFNITLRHKLKSRNSTFIVLPHSTFRVESSTMRIDHQYYKMGVKAPLVSSGVVLFNFYQ